MVILAGRARRLWVAAGLLGWACDMGGAGAGSAANSEQPGGAGIPGDQGAVQEYVLGTSYSVPSDIYETDLRITVHLPEGYDEGLDRYPVVYATHSRFPHLAGTLTDLGGTQIPPSILVYLETYDSGDFLPTAISSRPGSGGADRLLHFFAEELIPYIDGRYRTQPFRLFHSGSWGGVFCLHALISRPESFQGCIASTPWVIYDRDQQHLVRSAGMALRAGEYRHNFLYVALGNDPDPGLREGVEALADTVRAVDPEGLTFEYRFMPDEDHYSAGHKAFFDGLRWIFRSWAQVPDSVLEAGPEGIARYLTANEERYGYAIGAHWGAPYRRGFELLTAGDLAQAREMFWTCADLATVPACSTGLGRAYEAEGNLPEAERAYRRALDLATRQGSPDLARFHDDLKRVGGG